MNLRDWYQRVHRRVLAWKGRTFHALPRGDGPMVGLFCECEGRYAGPAGERYAERGMDRLLGLLDRHGLRMTFNVVAELCRSEPRRIRRVIDAGHEIACHGWKHERPRELARAELESMLRNAAECFGEVGVRVEGFRSPQTAWSPGLLRSLIAHGYRWNAERDRAARPYRIMDGLVRVGITTDDWDLAEDAGDVGEVMAKWRRCVREGAETGRVVCLGIHEWLVGQREEYAAALDAFLAEAKTGPAMRLATLGEVAGFSGKPEQA